MTGILISGLLVAAFGITLVIVYAIIYNSTKEEIVKHYLNKAPQKQD